MTPDTAKQIAARLLREPDLTPAVPAAAEVLADWERSWRTELAKVDEELALSMQDWIGLRERLRAVHLARHGTGLVGTARCWWPVAWPGAAELAPKGKRPISGKALRDILVDVLTAVGTPLQIGDLLHLLRLAGREPAGDPVKTLSDALRRDARVVRVGRGHYRAAGDPDASAGA